MWKRSHSKVFKSIERETIWHHWSDVNRWHEWVPNIEYCRLDKPFATGNHFTLKPKGGSVVTVELLDVQRGQKFTGCTRFFGATLYDTYEMNSDANGVRVTVTLKVTGPLGFLWRKLVAEKIEANLPKLMQNLIGLSTPQKQQKAKSQLGSIASKKVAPIISIASSKKSKPKLSSSASRKVTPIPTTSSATKGKSMSSSSTSKKVTPILSISPTTKGKTMSTASAVKKAKTKTSLSKPKKTVVKKSPAAVKKPKTKVSVTKPKKITAKTGTSTVKKSKTKVSASKTASKPKKTTAKKATSAVKKT
jgi:hypothetical protein